MISKGGVLRSGAVVNLAAAGAANAAAVYQVSNFAQQVGTKSFKIKRLLVQNDGGGNCWLSIGLGIPGVANMPALFSVNNLDAVWDNLPEVEYFADVTMWPDALPGGGTLNVQVEIEEIG